MLIGAAVYAFHWWTVGRFRESTDNAYVEADTAVIASRVAGYVAAVHVTDNQPVGRGQPLFALDDRDLAASLARARADLAIAAAGVTTSGATTLSERAAIAEAEGALAAARANAAQARSDLERIGAIYRKGFATRAVFDAAVAANESRAAAVLQAQAAVAAQRARRAAAASQGGGATAEVAAARAALEAAMLNLSYARIVAPIDGVVGNRSVRVGEYVRAGQQTMVIVPMAQTYLVANFKETQVAAMRPGQRVMLEVDAWPDARVTGRIESLSPASGSRFSILPPENATGNFTKIVQRIPVRIAIDRPLPAGVRLAPGMSVSATVDVRDRG